LLGGTTTFSRCRALGRAVGLLGATRAVLLGPGGIGRGGTTIARVAAAVAAAAPVEGAGSGTAPAALLAGFVGRRARGGGRHYFGPRGSTGLTFGTGRAATFGALRAVGPLAAPGLAGFARLALTSFRCGRSWAGLAGLGAVAAVFVFALALAALAATFYLVVEAV
jgi:hypothetical protein